MNIFEPVLKKEDFLKVLKRYENIKRDDGRIFGKYGEIITKIQIFALECFAESHDLVISKNLYYLDSWGISIAIAYDKKEFSYIVIAKDRETDDGRPDLWEIKDRDWEQTVEELYSATVCLICRREYVKDYLKDYLYYMTKKCGGDTSDDALEEIEYKIYDDIKIYN